jgi:hypothetical protein
MSKVPSSPGINYAHICGSQLCMMLFLQRANLALHHAAMRGHADIVKMLIDAGSDIDGQDKVSFSNT